jgi:hypothetical protein
LTKTEEQETIIINRPGRSTYPEQKSPNKRSHPYHHAALFMSSCPAAIAWAIGTLLLEQNDEWQLQRPPMQLAGLQTLSDNRPARLSAVAN